MGDLSSDEVQTKLCGLQKDLELRAATEDHPLPPLLECFLCDGMRLDVEDRMSMKELLMVNACCYFNVFGVSQLISKWLSV